MITKSESIQEIAKALNVHFLGQTDVSTPVSSKATSTFEEEEEFVPAKTTSSSPKTLVETEDEDEIPVDSRIKDILKDL